MPVHPCVYVWNSLHATLHWTLNKSWYLNNMIKHAVDSHVLFVLSFIATKDTCIPIKSCDCMDTSQTTLSCNKSANSNKLSLLWGEAWKLLWQAEKQISLAEMASFVIILVLWIVSTIEGNCCMIRSHQSGFNHRLRKVLCAYSDNYECNSCMIHWFIISNADIFFSWMFLLVNHRSTDK